VLVRGLPTGDPINPVAKFCDLCLRVFAHPHRKLAPLPGHPGAHACPVCRDADNDPRMIAWWLARDVDVRRQCIRARHGIDPLSWNESQPHAEQQTITEDAAGLPLGVQTTPLALSMPAPRTFWDVQRQRPNAVRDAQA
jgi:hypothetical protein